VQFDCVEHSGALRLTVEHTGAFKWTVWSILKQSNICLPTRLKYTDFDSLTHMCEVLRAVDVEHSACHWVACGQNFHLVLWPDCIDSIYCRLLSSDDVKTTSANFA